MWASGHRSLDADFRVCKREAKLAAEDQVRGGLGDALAGVNKLSQNQELEVVVGEGTHGSALRGPLNMAFLGLFSSSMKPGL